MSDEEPLTPSLMLSRIQSRIAHNLSGTFGTLTGTDYIRLVAIVGGYLLLRPYLEKLGAKYQERDHARAIDENEQDSMAATGQKARVIAGEGYDLDEEDESSDEEGWGRKKRLQQRKERARKKKEIEDRIKAEEDEEDKEIQEFLQD
ncbi:hypothetical protein TWF106_001988 [Orbilia oligospora]|uniref:Uncharacterized protein n=1 Tax=Orbilia oligospora TaxID=2813651 RepID=A0A6G1MBK7_ORBOL|nr:hypothetical protein TWF788_009113 [Orbilia oligospora]KAF3203436.1 hypothetical protein TWF106_001988 [Orbilia oligospora]KAF3214932.1 hypothetical protein TWF191_009622 [Orbilia oligospora]KAF3216477.1 hypothetical protein TWF679_003091 [Orbilia oligospora]KAF3251038.1 hypothetical protein TWF192_005016 [Orbilia oligospora]